MSFDLCRSASTRYRPSLRKVYPLSVYLGNCTNVAEPVTRDHIVTRSYSLLDKDLNFRTRKMRTPHSEKHKTCRPSGAHSAFARPSTPASIFAFQVLSRILKMWTTPRLAQVARMCSESTDHPKWVIHPSESTGFLDLRDCFPDARMVEELEGVLSNSQVLVI